MQAAKVNQKYCRRILSTHYQSYISKGVLGYNHREVISKIAQFLLCRWKFLLLSASVGIGEKVEGLKSLFLN